MLGNLRIKLLALGFAIALWSVVAYTQNPTQSARYQLAVDPPKLPAGLVIVGDIPQVLVTVTATADNLRQFDRKSLHATADFSGAKVGTDRVPVRITNPDPNVQVEAPTSLIVPVDELASTTTVVAIDRVHSLPAGFHEQTASTTVTPASVKIDGPRSQLVGIQAVVRIELDGLLGPFDLPYAVVVLDAKKKVLKSVTVTPAAVSVKMTIQADAVTETKPIGWTLTGQPAAGYRVTNVTLSPLQDNATGLLNALALISLLSTDPVDVTNATSDIVRVITVRPPAGVEVSQKTVQIHVYISKSAQVQPSTSP